MDNSKHINMIKVDKIQQIEQIKKISTHFFVC